MSDTQRTVILLYQCGIANVFATDVPNADNEWRTVRLQRVFQGDFRSAENIALGARLGGAYVMVMAWEGAGDALASRHEWEHGSGYLFQDARHSINTGEPIRL